MPGYQFWNIGKSCKSKCNSFLLHFPCIIWKLMVDQSLVFKIITVSNTQWLYEIVLLSAFRVLKIFISIKTWVKPSLTWEFNLQTKPEPLLSETVSIPRRTSWTQQSSGVRRTTKEDGLQWIVDYSLPLKIYEPSIKGLMASSQQERRRNIAQSSLQRKKRPLSATFETKTGLCNSLNIISLHCSDQSRSFDEEKGCWLFCKICMIWLWKQTFH